jgi:endonuclease/exonuclease/phosphatase family metal-dependent hydrolase
VHVTPELALCFGGPVRSEASVLPATRTASASAPDASPRAAAGGAELRVVTANLQYGQADPERLWQCLDAYDADLVMLAEVCEPNRAGTSWTALAAQWRERYPYQHAGPGSAFHILLLSRFPLEATQDHALEPPVARPGVPWTQRRALVETDVRLPERTVKVFAAHFPIPYGEWSLAARAQLVDRIGRERDGSPVIVLGDLNATSTSALFADLCAKAGVRDSRRGFGPCFSWAQVVPWRVIAIDHVLVSDEIAVLHRGVGPELGSDHLPALAALSVAMPGAAVRPTTGAASDRSSASSAPR